MQKASNMAKGISSIKALRRSHPVQDSTSATISPAGTTVELTSAGLKVIFPAGAVSKQGSFSVSAHPEHVGFSASLDTPLEKPVVISQLIDGEETNLVLVSGWVGEGDMVSGLSSARKMTYDTATKRAEAAVQHFSGYEVAVGGTMVPCDPTVLIDGSCVYYDT